MSEGERLGRARILDESDSGKAWKIWIDDLGLAEWIPKSVIHDDSEVFDLKENRRGELVIDAGFARKHGLA